MLRQPETLNYLLLELINDLRWDSNPKVFAFMKHLNFQLEIEIDPFKNIFEGIFTEKCSHSSNFFFFDFWASMLPF